MSGVIVIFNILYLLMLIKLKDTEVLSLTPNIWFFAKILFLDCIMIIRQLFLHNRLQLCFLCSNILKLMNFYHILDDQWHQGLPATIEQCSCLSEPDPCCPKHNSSCTFTTSPIVPDFTCHSWYWLRRQIHWSWSRHSWCCWIWWVIFSKEEIKERSFLGSAKFK